MEGATTIHPGTISGVLDGHAVSVEATGRMRQTYLMTVTVGFRKPLGIGLRLESDPALRDQLADHRTYVDFFDEEFQKRFQPRADEPLRAARIVGDGVVNSVTKRLAEQGKGIRFTDDEIIYFADSVEGRTDKLVSLIRTLVALADRVETAAR